MDPIVLTQKGTLFRNAKTEGGMPHTQDKEGDRKDERSSLSLGE